MRDETSQPERTDSDHNFEPRQHLIPGGTTFTAALNALTPLSPTLAGLVGDTVDVLNNLTQGSLVRVIPGPPPGPRARTFELQPLPDTGAGNLALPALGAVPGKGTITPVNDLGQPVQSGATGVSLSGGAYLASLDPISGTLYVGCGWALTFRYRVPTGAKNSSRSWVSIGKRALTNYGISVTENTGGGLVATIEDPRQTLVRVTSANISRDMIHTARLAWNATSKMVQWQVDGVASGAAVALTFRPEIGNGKLYVGTSLALSAGSTPTGFIYSVSFEAVAQDQSVDYEPVGPSESLSAADARTLLVDSRDILTPVADAGDISLTWSTASGDATQGYNVRYQGYVAPLETLTSYVSADMPYVPVDQGSANSDYATLLLTPPTRGKIATARSTDFFSVGSVVPVQGDGIPPRSYLQYQPAAGGTLAGQNPQGSLTRGMTDLVRTQQDAAVRVTNIIEMNRAPKLNGGGEAWGHADDVFVPIHALLYDYDDGSGVFPTIDGETPSVTVAEVPQAGEGKVRVLRTGPDLQVGNTIAFADVKRLGWYKPGVASVRAACRLRLTIAAPGAPTSTEDYAFKITDAARPAGMTYWAQADAIYSDRHTRVRWAAKGGDWAGTDGLWGATPYAASPLVTRGGVVTLDVTAMAKSFGPELFLQTASVGAASVVPGFYTPDPTREPMLRVTGGARAGTWRSTRSAPISLSDTTGWVDTTTGLAILKRGQALLLAFDGAGTAATLADATKIEIVLNVVNATGGGAIIQAFRPAPQPPRPGPRVTVGATPTATRADLITKVDTDADWLAMLNHADSRNDAGAGQPTNYTIANGCYYGGIPTGFNGGLSLFRGFFKADGTGYPVVRLGRMCGWHVNYQPGDANLNGLGVSGKSPGIIATGSGTLFNLTAGYGGRTVSGYSGYTMRMQRGSPSNVTHPSTSPLQQFMAFGDYDYFLSGNDHGLTTFGINPLQRMKWLWIETVHSVNSIYPDGTWANDGVFELYVNGRKQSESRRLEWRVAGNNWLWDTIWYDEYNGGVDPARVDRLWPFVIGPTYAVSTNTPIAPPPGWNVPFVTAAGTPDSVALPYRPDF